ncbi:MAG TPA: L-histidine N(alpha)-methyltransferase [Aeromonadales bacterium]|nr:L-histidine N(alpha)-methyltransferase [Aeromonadales bacterium]
MLTQTKTAPEAVTETRSNSIAFYDFHPQFDSMLSEVWQGLSETPKKIHPKFFYDARGSQLFDQICQLDEYYPTRTEVAILEKYKQEIAELAGEYAALIEMGSGSSHKIRILLDAMQPAAYLPLDISRDHLISSSQRLAEEYPWLDVHAACIDYSTAWKLPYRAEKGQKVAFFPGSSIGNFDPEDAHNLLKEIAQLVGPKGNLIIGVDRVKDKNILEAAYNDHSGITAQFNLNLLQRINEELDANFDLNNFSHKAFFNTELNRIEMHLTSNIPQYIKVAGKTFFFEQDETLHTESSYKYSIENFTQLALNAGFKCKQIWSDEKDWFSVYFLQVN